MKTFKKMLKIEAALSLRDMNMLIFAIIMPLVVMIIVGIVYGKKPAFDGAGYTFMEQSFGAISSIAILAGGTMGLPILVSDYRERKILKRFQVTPVSPAMILSVHVTIYAMYSACSLLIVWVIAKLFFGFQMHGSWLSFLGGWLMVLISMLSIGMMVGGIAKNSKQAGIIATLLYFPMLVFSGTTLPYEIMPRPLQIFSDLLPMTQGIKLLKAASLGLPMDSVMISISVIILLALVCIGISLKAFKWE
ncbi:MAG: transporter [Herbinix sp.]|jgi:ABC-2 type transport system permease protein|nr:transporter [Herbinix sp.]